MTSNAKIGAAVVGGYVLGRRKKAKVALGLSMLLAGAGARRKQLAKALSESPIVGTVNERLRGELVDAGKAAATTVLTARADKLADAIHSRTEGLREKDHEGEEPEKTEPADEAAEGTEPEGEEPEGTEPEGEEPEDTEPEGEEPEDTEPEGEAPEDKASEGKEPAHTGTSRARKTTKPREKASASGTRKRSADDG
ncbi:ABC transporter substrate-binding protein [Streptomyces sp. NPDC001530]|uniref:ABC transporter substrate-binding protein n=1 Tax=Streptomyces sp. NPDC001530 TaxID=3364582 RepID=UPI00368A6B55